MSKKRSTYSLPNAMRFKPLFDKALQTRKDYKLSPRGSPGAFQAKVSDALKWLIENYDHPHVDTQGQEHKQGEYAMLRGLAKIRMVSGGDIVLSLFTNRSEELFSYKEIDLNNPAQVARLTDRTHQDNLAWRRTIFNWIENKAQDGETLRLEKLNLNEEEQQFIQGVLGELKDCVFDVDVNTVVAKIKKS